MRVEFHTDVAEPLGFACRLLRKAYRSGAKVAVFAPAALLTRLDRELWIFEERDFIPHARWTGPPRQPGLARTPIWLVAPGAPPPPCDTAVNVALDDIDAFASFERVIEIVAGDADTLQAARRRWRLHRERGAQIEHHAHGAP